MTKITGETLRLHTLFQIIALSTAKAELMALASCCCKFVSGSECPTTVSRHDKSAYESSDTSSSHSISPSCLSQPGSAQCDINIIWTASHWLSTLLMSDNAGSWSYSAIQEANCLISNRHAREASPGKFRSVNERDTKWNGQGCEKFHVFRFTWVTTSFEKQPTIFIGNFMKSFRLVIHVASTLMLNTTLPASFIPTAPRQITNLQSL